MWFVIIFAEHVVGGGSQYIIFVMLGGSDLQSVYSIGYQLGMISGATGRLHNFWILHFVGVGAFHMHVLVPVHGPRPFLVKQAAGHHVNLEELLF